MNALHMSGSPHQMKDTENHSNIRLVTLLGDWPLQHPWVLACMNSWRNLNGIQPQWLVLSDGTLNPSLLPRLEGITLEADTKKQESIVLEKLSTYPCLRKIRSLDLTWRKIIDLKIMCQEEVSVLLIDTDVLVRRKVSFPKHDLRSGPVYLREDIPAYQGDFRTPWKFPMVMSFNAGFVWLNPDCVDLALLERLAKNCVLTASNTWWTEQLAWSVIAGSSGNPMFWDGRDARVVSGFRTRSPEQIEANQVHLFSSKQELSSDKEMIQYAGNASVVHLAGYGKKHYHALVCKDPAADAGTDHALRLKQDHTLNTWQSLGIAARLLAKEYQSRLKSILST